MNKKTIAGMISFVVIVVLAVSLSASAGNRAKEELGERASINQQYQTTWQSISTNIDNILPLANVIAQEYSKVSSDPSFENRFVDMNFAIKSTDNKTDKYKTYVEIVTLIGEIQGEVDDKGIDNDILSVGINNMNVFTTTIDILRGEYNEQVEKYNETFGVLINRENKSKGITKEKLIAP